MSGPSAPRAPAAVVLLGLRCSGKTSVGRLLAGRLGWPFHDSDAELARRFGELSGASGREAGEVLAEVGLERFRRLERDALTGLLAQPGPRVVATGAGCVETPEVRRMLRGARCVWLRVELAELRARMEADPTPRPSLTGADPLLEIPQVAARREPLYRALASAVIDCGGAAPAELAERLARRFAPA